MPVLESAGDSCAGHILLSCRPNCYPKRLPPSPGLPQVDEVEDPNVRLMGMHLRVLCDRPVWPLAFHQFVTARDWRAFVEGRLEWRDFSPVPLGPHSLSALYLGELLVVCCDKWVCARMPADEADHVLVALGLLHMRVKCVIPEELGDDYQPAVSV